MGDGPDPWLWDADAHQRLIYEKVGFDPDEPVLMMDLARASGVRIVFVKHGDFVGDAELEHDGEGWVCKVRSGIPLHRKAFAVAHELAEMHLSEEVDAGIEDACNALAAALLAPRRSFERAMRRHGGDAWEQLALPFRITETHAALRTAEIRGRRLIVVTPHKVYARGEWWGLPESRLRALARAEQLDLPGLRKASLRDDPKRVVLIHEDADVESA